MVESQPLVEEEHRTLRACCLCACVCLVLLAAVVVFQAATGAALAVMSLRGQPADEASRASAVSLYSCLRSLHSGVGQTALVPAFVLLAASILFTLNVGAVQTRHTRFMWAQLARAALLCTMLTGTCVGGRMFVMRLVNADFWLVLSPQRSSSTAGITMDGFSSTYFYTFVGLHGIVLPLLAAITIIFMWPPIYEFVRAWLSRPRHKGLLLKKAVPQSKEPRE